MTKQELAEIVGNAIALNFSTVNPMGNEKNVADGLLYIGNGLHEIAKALNSIAAVQDLNRR